MEKHMGKPNTRPQEDKACPNIPEKDLFNRQDFNLSSTITFANIVLPTVEKDIVLTDWTKISLKIKDRMTNITMLLLANTTIVFVKELK